MQKSNPWLNEAKSTVTPVKHLQAGLLMGVRTSQYRLFEKLLKPNPRSKILDVGVASDNTLKNTNTFELLYPYLENLTAVTIEDPKIIRKNFPTIRVVKTEPGKRLPFKDNQFDIVTSWATLEHTGGYKEQKFFMKELQRVGKKVFVTTPYRGCIYEPHSDLFFLHWLPLKIFRQICKIIGRDFWAKEENLNPLFVRDVQKICPGNRMKTKVYRMFGFLPSHLIIYGQKGK